MAPAGRPLTARASACSSGATRARARLTPLHCRQRPWRPTQYRAVSYLRRRPPDLALVTIFPILNQNTLGLTVYQNSSKYFRFGIKRVKMRLHVPRRPLASTHGFGSYRSACAQPSRFYVSLEVDPASPIACDVGWARKPRSSMLR